MEKKDYSKQVKGKINSRIELNVIRKFFTCFKPQWSLVFVGGLLILMISLLQLPGPFLSQYLIDHTLPKGEKTVVIILSGVILGLLISKSLLSILNRYVLSKFRESFLLNIKLSFFKHVLSLPVSFFKSHDTSYVLTRMSTDTEETQGVFADNMLAAVSNFLTFIVGVSALFYIHWKLALISVIVLPFYIISGSIFIGKIRQHAPVIQENAAQIGRLIGESFLGIFVIKTFAKENNTVQKLKKLLNKKRIDSIKMSLLNSMNENACTFVGGAGSIIVLGYGILEIINGNLTLGKLVAFNAFLSYLYSPLASLMGINARLQRSISAMSRIFEIIDKPTEFEGADASNPSIDLNQINGAVNIKGLDFSYNGNGKALDNISVDIKPGERVAVVGKSGAGKTTLVNLIPRFYEPENGEILLDGIPLKQIPKTLLRDMIGFVPQDTFLFHGTIFDNIRFANPDATDEDILKAVKESGIDVFLDRLSMDLNTNVGVLGTKLSGGQKQLISIARVFIKKPKLLIFDEATAHLDFETENLLKEAINKLITGKTTFIIAHRLSTVLNSHKILALEKGKVVGVGTHSQLYATNTFYKNIFDQQFINMADAN